MREHERSVLPRKGFVAVLLIVVCIFLFVRNWPYVSADSFISGVSVFEKESGEIIAMFSPEYVIVRSLVPCEDFMAIKYIDLLTATEFDQGLLRGKEGYAIVLTIGEREFDVKNPEYLPKDYIRRFFLSGKYVKVWKIELIAHMPAILPARARHGHEWDLDEISKMPSGERYADIIRCSEQGGVLEVSALPGAPNARAVRVPGGELSYGYVYVPMRVISLEWIPTKEQKP